MRSLWRSQSCRGRCRTRWGGGRPGTRRSTDAGSVHAEHRQATVGRHDEVVRRDVRLEQRVLAPVGRVAEADRVVQHQRVDVVLRHLCAQPADSVRPQRGEVDGRRREDRDAAQRIAHLSTAAGSNVKPVPGRSGITSLPSRSSTSSTKSGANQSTCSTEMQFGSDAGKGEAVLGEEVRRHRECGSRGRGRGLPELGVAADPLEVGHQRRRQPGHRSSPASRTGCTRSHPTRSACRVRRGPRRGRAGRRRRPAPRSR